MERIHRALRLLERIWVRIAATMLFAIMLVATADVVMRYAFNAPLSWSYDVIGMYLMAGVFFFALADTLEENGHVAVDLLHARLSPRTRHLFEIPGYLFASVAVTAIAWLAASRALQSWRADEVIAGSFDYPTWIAAAFVALGFLLMLARMLFRLVGHVASAITGRDVIALPPIAGEEAL